MGPTGRWPDGPSAHACIIYKPNVNHGAYNNSKAHCAYMDKMYMDRGLKEYAMNTFELKWA